MEQNIQIELDNKKPAFIEDYKHRLELAQQRVKTATGGKRRELGLTEPFPDSLPSYSFKDELLKAIAEKQIIIVTGESGKAIQIPQILINAGYGGIGCTQTRRAGTIAAAEQLAKELESPLGGKVGYEIRFEEKISSETAVKFMTDGVLLRECLVDANLSRYTVIILNEVNKRTLHTDVLCALLKATATSRRADLKLIITTKNWFDLEKFCTYFGDDVTVIQTPLSTATKEKSVSPVVIPEIHQSKLTEMVLHLLAMGVSDLVSFDFLDTPPADAVISALEELYSFGALDQEGHLTTLGRQMAQFPLECRHSKLLLQSVALGCSDEALTLVSLVAAAGNLSAVFRGKSKSQFAQPKGDKHTLVALYNEWQKAGKLSSWCNEYDLSEESLKRAEVIRKQLLTIMKRNELELVSGGSNATTLLQKAICSALFCNVATKDQNGVYRKLVDGSVVYMWPSLYNLTQQQQPEWLVYDDDSSPNAKKEYMGLHGTTPIEPDWLVELAPRFYRFADTLVNKEVE